MNTLLLARNYILLLNRSIDEARGLLARHGQRPEIPAGIPPQAAPAPAFAPAVFHGEPLKAGCPPFPRLLLNVHSNSTLPPYFCHPPTS
jgi:hypothetical protein